MAGWTASLTESWKAERKDGWTAECSASPMVALKAALTAHQLDLQMAVHSDDQKAARWDRRWDETPAAKKEHWTAGWSAGSWVQTQAAWRALQLATRTADQSARHLVVHWAGQ